MKINKNLETIEYLNDAISVEQLEKEIVEVNDAVDETITFNNSYGFPSADQMSNNYGIELSNNIEFISDKDSYWAGGNYNFIQVQNSSNIFKIKNCGSFTISITIASTSNVNSRDIILKTDKGTVLETKYLAPASVNYQNASTYTTLTFNVSEDVLRDVIIASSGGAVRIRQISITYQIKRPERKLMLSLKPESFYLHQVETFSLAEGVRDNSSFSGESGYVYFTRLNFKGKLKLNDRTRIIIGRQNQNQRYSCRVKIFKATESSSWFYSTWSFNPVAISEYNNADEKKLTTINEEELDGSNIYYVGIWSQNNQIDAVGFNNEDVCEKVNPPISFKTYRDYTTFTLADTESNYQTFAVKIITPEEERYAVQQRRVFSR